MKKFVVLYYSPKEAMEKMKTSTPEEMQAGQKAWMDWFAEIGDNLVEQGSFFGSGKQFKGKDISDSTGKVTGYSLIQCSSMEEAESLIKNHPHLDWHPECSVEVYEPMQMGK